MQPHLGRGDRDVELGGDVLVRESVDVLQQDDVAELDRQGLDRVARRRSSASADSAAGPGSDSSRSSIGSHVVVERLGPLAAALPGVGGRRVRGDPVHPRRELRFAAEAPDPSPGSEIGVLGHVPCVLLVTGEPTGQGERVDVGLAHQLVECFPIALLGGPDQLTVVHGCSRSTPVRTHGGPERLRRGHMRAGTPDASGEARG